MTVDGAYEFLRAGSPLDVGKFYGIKGGVALGAGLIYEKVLSPLFSIHERLFITVRQAVYVLTHECDVDVANDWPFNDFVCFCPVIPLAAFIAKYQGRWVDEERLASFLTAVAQRHVSRVVYVPPGPGLLSHGGLVYLNNIDSTHISSFEGLEPLVALSEYGLREIDTAFKNSLWRPKADRLSFG